MRKIAGPCMWTCCLTGFFAATAAGQVPTFSMKLVEINSTPVVGHGTPRMTVAPGDLLTIELLLRDWSPEGEVCAAYQAELDHDSFATGTSGSIKPVAYDVTTLRGESNPKNAFIDLTDGRFVHKGEQTVAFADTDTVHPGYRWMSVLFRNGGPMCAQDGINHYCGTLKAYVSKDAEGTFTYSYTPGPNETGLLKEQGKAVLPVEVEPLILEVVRTGRPAWITASTPTCDAVDARSPRGAKPAPWTVIELSFSGDAGAVSGTDFKVDDGTPNPPKITGIESRGKRASLTLDKPINAQAWTHITHTASGTTVRFGRLHGDVDCNGSRNGSDLARLIQTLNRGTGVQAYHCDIDGSGRINAGDVLELIELVASKAPVGLVRRSAG